MNEQKKITFTEYKNSISANEQVALDYISKHGIPSNVEQNAHWSTKLPETYWDYHQRNEGFVETYDLETYYVVKEGYYIGWSDKVGMYVVSDRKAKKNNSFYDAGSDYFNIYSGMVITQTKVMIGNIQGTKPEETRKQLTRMDFNKLRDAKLPWEALRKCYLWHIGGNNRIRFNLGTPNLVL